MKNLFKFLGATYLLLITSEAQAQMFVGRRAHPISTRVLGTTNTTAGASEYVLSNIASGPGRLLICLSITSDTVQPDNHSVSSRHGTWLQVSTNVWYDTVTVPLHLISLWYVYATDNTSSSVTNRFTNGATGGSMAILELAGTAVYRSNAAVTNRTVNSANAGANPTITLSAFNGGADAVVAILGSDANPFGGTAEAGWVEDMDSGYANPATGSYLTHSVNRSDNTVAVTAASADWGGIAVQVRAQ